MNYLNHFTNEVSTFYFFILTALQLEEKLVFRELVLSREKNIFKKTIEELKIEIKDRFILNFLNFIFVIF